MRVLTRKDSDDVALEAAAMFVDLFARKPDCVLGLATGATPLGLYGRLIEAYGEGRLDFEGVTTFNLDEYYGLQPDDPQSYRHFMESNLFRHVNIKGERAFVPRGDISYRDVEAFCSGYEALIRGAGGIDLQLLGIGSDGHIGFNEPGSSLRSRTRLVALDPRTIKDNARFFAREEECPGLAVTMGVGTILEAAEIVLIATGSNKAEAVAEALEGPVASMIPASALQMHPKTTFILDEAAASLLKKRNLYMAAERTEGETGLKIY